MFTSTIQDILTRRLQVMPAIVVGKKFHRDWDELVKTYFASGAIAIVDDVDTAEALGDTIYRALKDRYDCTHIILPRGITANDDMVKEIESRAANVDLLIAVGAGTINDLTKHVAHKTHKPYLLCPTAASMNGYLSANASIAMQGKKQSLKATLPMAVIADMSIIAAAPTRLTQAGLGDSLARPTAQADWLLEHYLLGTPYDEELYIIMAEYEASVFEQARGLLQHDEQIIENLFSLILLSGLGMTIASSSQPASGGEHMIAHAMGMAMDDNDTRYDMLHGEEIAVTSLLSAERWEQLLTIRGTLASTYWPKDLMLLMFGESHTAYFGPLYQTKAEALNAHYPDLRIPAEKWGTICEHVSPILIPRERMAQIRRYGGLPSSVEQLGWNKTFYQEITKVARFTRNRISWLDLTHS